MAMVHTGVLDVETTSEQKISCNDFMMEMTRAMMYALKIMARLS